MKAKSSISRLFTLLAASAALCVTAYAAGGDAARGQQVYESRCGGCHSLDSSRVGPRHRGVFGRRAGAVPDFSYSPALAMAKVIWNASTLDQWLRNPEAFLPGQRMNIRVQTEQDRADIIAFLRAESMKEGN